MAKELSCSDLVQSDCWRRHRPQCRAGQGRARELTGQCSTCSLKNILKRPTNELPILLLVIVVWDGIPIRLHPVGCVYGHEFIDDGWYYFLTFFFHNGIGYFDTDCFLLHGMVYFHTVYIVFNYGSNKSEITATGIRTVRPWQ